MKTVVVSVSGGRTSAFMAIWAKNNRRAIADYLGEDGVDLVFVFANSGQEHPDTLRFVSDLDEAYDLGIVWVEAVIHHGQRRGSTHRVVTADTCKKHNQFEDDDHPFSNYIKKYGIPNVRFIGCTRELKLAAINSYIKNDLGLSRGDYISAVGIRADEPKRISKKAAENGVFYPLAHIEYIEKHDVIDFFCGVDWDLKIPEHLGNCITCYKKSYKKLKLVNDQMPFAFDFNRAMEDRYSDGGKRAFFRMGHSTDSLIKMFDISGDVGNYVSIRDSGCSESCEAFGDGQFDLFL